MVISLSKIQLQCQYICLSESLFERSTPALRLCVQQGAECILTPVAASFLSVCTLCPVHHTHPIQSSARINTYTHFLPSCIPPPPQCDIEQPVLSAQDQHFLQQSFFTPQKCCSCRGSFRATRVAWASHRVCDTKCTTVHVSGLL